jgi:hypothetical protein
VAVLAADEGGPVQTSERLPRIGYLSWFAYWEIFSAIGLFNLRSDQVDQHTNRAFWRHSFSDYLAIATSKAQDCSGQNNVIPRIRCESPTGDIRQPSDTFGPASNRFRSLHEDSGLHTPPVGI